MNNDFLVIPADGSLPFFIPQYGSINDTYMIYLSTLFYDSIMEEFPL